MQPLNKFHIANAMIRKFLKQFPSGGKQEIGGHEYFQNDLFIAEFPKSGVTWLSTIFAHLEIAHLEKNGVRQGKLKRSIGFGALPSFVSDDTLSSNLSPYTFSLFGGRVIKTHNLWSKSHHRVVYLFRHPAHVMHSYWLMMKGYNLIDPNTSLVDFCFNSSYGLPAWKSHIRSYLFNSDPGCVITFLSYEQLIDNTFDALSRILKVFSCWESPEDLLSTINLTSRKQMSLAEDDMIVCDLRHQARFSAGYKFVGPEHRNAAAIKSIETIVLSSCEDEIRMLYPKLFD